MLHQSAAPTAPEPVEWRGYFERSPEMLCVLDARGVFVAVNESFATSFGREPSWLIGRPFAELVHPDDRLASAAKLEPSTSADGATLSFENRYRREDGEYLWVSWRVHRDDARQLLYCAAHDDSERQEQSLVVGKLLAELERSNTDLAQFAYVASHDLSEPLRMVSSYVQLLADRYQGKLDDDADEFIGFAVDGAARMKALIDDLLAYSRAGATPISRRSVDCAALVRAALADLDLAITEAGARVTVGALPMVTGDPAQLSLLFSNLISNALKFVAADVTAVVNVSAERGQSEWCFAVEDNGIGIAHAHRARIFVMLKRLHGRSAYPGTGIGLALCHKIVSRAGGRIWLEDGATAGTVFKFTLPDESYAGSI